MDAETNEKETGYLILMLLKIEVKTHYILFTMLNGEQYTLFVISTLQMRVLPKKKRRKKKHKL